MDHDMRNVDPALPGVALNQSVNDPSRDDYDTAEELQERAELAAELEALLDAAAASGEDSDIQESLQPLQSGQDIDMADKGHEESPDAGGDSAEDSSAVYSDSDQENESPPRSPHQSISAEIHQGPLIFSPADRHIQPPAEIHQGPLIFSPADRHIQPPAEIHEGPLIFSPADRHIQPEVAEPSTPPQKRVKRIPVSPIKKFVAQQFLNQSRDQLRALAQARGSQKLIPDPSIILRFGRRNREDQPKRTVKKTLGPAKDSKEVLVELMKEVDRDHPAQSGTE